MTHVPSLVSSLRVGGEASSAHRLLWIGTRYLDRRIGDGNGQRTCRAPDPGIAPSAWADGKVRQLALGGTHCGTKSSHGSQ
jgi:hypothetical protein